LDEPAHWGREIKCRYSHDTPSLYKSGSYTSKSQPWTQNFSAFQYVATGMTGCRPAVRSTCANWQFPLQGPVERRDWWRFCILPFRNVWLLCYTEATKEILESIHSDPIFNVMNVAALREWAIKIRLKRGWLHTVILSGSQQYSLLLFQCHESAWITAGILQDLLWHTSSPPKETWAFIHTQACCSRKCSALTCCKMWSPYGYKEDSLIPWEYSNKTVYSYS